MSTQYINEPPTKGKASILKSFRDLYTIFWLQVCLETSLGDIDIELWSKECPRACRNFVQLCMEGYYNKCLFHTVLKECIAQTGDPTGTGEGGESVYGEDFKVCMGTWRHSWPRWRSTSGSSSTAAAWWPWPRTRTVCWPHSSSSRSAPRPSWTGSTRCSARWVPNNVGYLFQIANNTVFNLLRFNKAELELDSENRPVNPLKILGAKVLSNPFNDIVPRELKSKEKKKKKKDKDVKPASSNTALLSFGDEMEDEDVPVLTNVSFFRQNSLLLDIYKHKITF